MVREWVLREAVQPGEDNGSVQPVQRLGCTWRVLVYKPVRLAGQSEQFRSIRQEGLVRRGATGRPVRCPLVALARSRKPQLTDTESQDGEDMKGIRRKPAVQAPASVQACIRRRGGLTAGSKIEWCGTGDDMLVRPASKYSSRDIHEAVFDARPERRSVADLDEGIRSRARRLHVRAWLQRPVQVERSRTIESRPRTSKRST